MLISHLTAALTIFIIAVNLVGLTIIASRLLNSYLLAKVVSPAALTLCFFFIEHFHGLGALNWLWPLTTLASLEIVRRNVGLLKENWKVEALFAACFGYCLLWRFTFPNIAPSSEKLADLALITSYLPGDRLPPVDAWLPPYRLDVYYAFQHYAAALIGRVLGLDGGTAYNLGFCVLNALTLTAAGGVARLICDARWKAALVFAAFAVGGTGASPLMHFVKSDPLPHESMRFIGGSAVPEQASEPFGQWLVGAANVPASNARELPAETLGYLIHLGDYHPPLSGFFLLTLGLLSIVLAERDRNSGAAQFILAASVVMTLASNAWSLPLQFFLAATWVVYRATNGKSVNWPALGSGVAAAGLLIYPFLSRFAPRAADYGASLKFVSGADHSPPLLALVVLYPALIVLVLQFTTLRRKSIAFWLTLLWLSGFLFSETFFIDDVYRGTFNRFNSTLKWWPWLYHGALLSVGAWNLNSKSRVRRWGTALMLVVVSTYAVDLASYFVRTPKPGWGRLDGSRALVTDRFERAVLEYLKQRPGGIVLQHVEADAFTAGPGLTTLAGRKAFLGWPSHEKLWRANNPEVERRRRRLRLFYAGDLADSAEWLIENRIDDVLWLKNENKAPAGTFEKIHRQIEEHYYWREFYSAGPVRVGVWSRRRQ